MNETKQRARRLIGQIAWKFIFIYYIYRRMQRPGHPRTRTSTRIHAPTT